MAGSNRGSELSGLRSNKLELDHDEDAQTYIEDPHTATLNYIRNEGTLEGSTVFDGDGGSSSMLLNAPGISHKRTVSNDRHLNSQVSQIQYNNNRIALDRSITNALHVLGELQKENTKRPIFYPTSDATGNHLLNNKKAHLALLKRNSMQQIKALEKQPIDDSDEEDTPDLRILKLNFKLDNNSILTLDKAAIAQLLNEKITQVTKHLGSIKERIDDTSSKVFITGDLNSGKSTFCNALLRRKILPEDQQPCTTVFCEVIDSKENNGIEEVHAVPIGSDYSIRDESTYFIFNIKELEHLVGECDKFSILKVYVDDKRSVDHSLLKNGVVDIALIDGPGLNMDSYQTTEVFSRQEEIDLVVFVLSAENHFTLSAREFIATAANERKFIFIVVNRFDNINDKNKCMSRILDQIKQLSPDTHKDARNFVHFVSSSEVVNGLPRGNGGGDDDPEGPNNNNNEDANPDFDHLENSLRNFVLQKRSLSKLQPAKTYLTKLFQDVEDLSAINQKLYVTEKESLTQKLGEITPIYEESLVQSMEAHEKIDIIIEATSKEAYEYSRSKILSTLNTVGNHPIVPYFGLNDLAQYTVLTQEAITRNILNSVTDCENYARKMTKGAVDKINGIGKEYLGEEYASEKVFREDYMFTRKRDSIARQLDEEVSVLDFFNPSVEGFLNWIGVNKDTASKLNVWRNSFYSIGLYTVSRVATTGSIAKGLFQYSSFFSLRGLKYFVVPLLVGAGIAGLGYLIVDIPNALARNLALKVRNQIEELDYPHQNSERISKECRKVLRYPAREIQNAYQSSLEKHVIQKEKLLSSIKDADMASAFFGKLFQRARDQRSLVESFDLENISTVD